MNIDVILHKDENGYWAEVPALKGCFTQGNTIEETIQNVKEAINAGFQLIFQKIIMGKLYQLHYEKYFWEKAL